MIALEREVSLRVESGSHVEIACLSGVVWATRAIFFWRAVNRWCRRRVA
jgi:hypothetical protein